MASTYQSMLYSDEKPKDGDAATLSELYDCCWLNCDKRFVSQDDLVMHVNHQHVRVQRPDVDYQCKWDGCQRRGRGFNARYKMLIHIRTHTNEKPHNCSLCGKSFSRLENLKIHNRSHTGEKPYICPFVGCNKAYSNSSDRFKHVRTHQEEKPYICKLPGCNKRYTDPSSLRKHVRTHGHYLYDTVESSKVKQDSSQSISIMTLPTNVMTNQAICRDGLTNQLLSYQNNIMHAPSLMSNPLLSSTIINSPITTQTTATQTDKHSVTLAVSPESPTHKVDLGQDGSILESEGKCQDSPLDLSTSPVSLPGNSEVCVDDSVSSSYSSKWDLIHGD